MSLPKPYYQRGPVTLYHGDCLELLPHIGGVDAVVTDPPYGVQLGDRKNNNRERIHDTKFSDTHEYVSEVAVAAVSASLKKAFRAVITPGVRNMWLYPTPSHVGAIYYPAATGCNAWGFSCWQPIFYYGKDPHGGKGSIHDSFQSTERAEINGHPCPKPIGQMEWIVKRASVADDTILDPFLGSGTTAVACIRTGRQCIGIELEEKYCEIAAKRCDRELDQKRLPFDTPKRTETQRELFAEVTA